MMLRVVASIQVGRNGVDPPCTNEHTNRVGGRLKDSSTTHDDRTESDCRSSAVSVGYIRGEGVCCKAADVLNGVE